MGPLKQDDSVFFMGSINASSASSAAAASMTKPEPEAKLGKLKRVFSAPGKNLKSESSNRRTSFSSLFKSRSKGVITEEDNNNSDVESISSSIGSSFSFMLFGSAREK